MDNPDHALNGNKEKELEKHEKLRKAKKAPNQTEMEYSLEKTAETLRPIYELEEKLKNKKKKKQVKN